MKRSVATICTGIAASIVSLSSVLAAGEQAAPQALAERAAREPARAMRVTFTITQGTKFASDSQDQITILFSDNSWGSSPPYPLFGDDVLAEFSFSAIDVSATRPLRFSRLVAGDAFLRARYIRVVNHGDSGWDGGTLTLVVDGRTVLDRVQLQPRQGDASKGFQNWNRKQWSSRTYWEADFQQLQSRRK